MGIYGTRDGVFKARALQLGQKRLQTDNYKTVLSSATLIKRADLTSTTAYTLGTALDHPRAVKAVNAVTTTAERAMDLVVKGYDAQGVYTEEVLSLSTGTTGVTSGNVAFGYISEIVGATSTKGYGTYGTVDIKMSDKLGLSEYCEDKANILQIDNYSAGATGTARTHTSTVGPTFSTGTTFSRTYQTLDVSALTPAGSTVGIKYLSKFQKRA